ncbi:MAG TPA: DegT/DnrJ/EryC1/StrS family aminotransferase, partial [Candidatus Methylomirabilis sp.]|nr:DegT/DnrJ/EryC1/StrS family aminotransferase [Candidatus Methylomirabilis sp.]
TFGDAGLFSLDKGKNITTIEGGIIVTRCDGMANALRAESECLPASGLPGNFMTFVKVILYAAFLRPGLYWLPNRLPSLGIGSTVYSEEYPVEQYRPFLARLGVRLLDRLREISQVRIENAEFLMKELEGTPRLLLPTPVEKASPVFLRFPVRILDRKPRDRCIFELNRLGISASPSYPGAINDIPEVRIGLSGEEIRLPEGRTLAGQILTLPTHPYVRRDDLVKMVDVLRQECTKEIPFGSTPG